MLDVGSKELIIIGVILVLLFGSKKLPEMVNVLAEAIKNIRRGLKADLPEEYLVSHGSQNKNK